MAQARGNLQARARPHARQQRFPSRPSDPHSDFRRLLPAFVAQSAKRPIGSDFVRDVSSTRADLSRPRSPLSHRTTRHSPLKALTETVDAGDTHRAAGRTARVLRCHNNSRAIWPSPTIRYRLRVKTAPRRRPAWVAFCTESFHFASKAEFICGCDAPAG